MSGRPFDPYAVLGLRPGASLLEIARARRRLAKRYHPDVAGGGRAAERMREVNAAWETLSDPARRHARQTDPWQAPGPEPDWATPGAWRYRPQHAAGPRAHAASDSRVGWFVLGGASLLMALILVAGLVAALDGPSMPGRNSPVLQDNLDAPGQR